VLDDAVGAREHQRLVAVVEAHEVRRSTVRPADLDDLPLALRGADRAAPDMEHVTDFGSHQITSTPQGRSARQAFEFGLQRVLDGIEVLVERRELRIELSD
jgi:hypothetical protein